MAEWRKYTGRDEQIAEMENAKNGFICKNDYGYIWDDVYIDWSKCPIGATHYLILTILDARTDMLIYHLKMLAQWWWRYESILIRRNKKHKASRYCYDLYAFQNFKT